MLSGSLSVVWVCVRNLEQLAAQLVLGLWPFFALMVVGLMRLRTTRQHIDRPYRVPFYPVVPIAFLAASMVLLVGSFVELPNVSVVNAATIALAFPVYFVWRRVTGAHRAHPTGR